MNVALLDRPERQTNDRAELAIRPAEADVASEWIDPEGDDWFTQIYREVVHQQERERLNQIPSSDLGHWFG